MPPKNTYATKIAYWEAAEYKRLCAEQAAIWKGPVLERDGFKCVICGTHLTETQVDLAHVSPKRDFYSVRLRVEDVAYSFRLDNLVSLCRVCHEVQHSQRRKVWDSRIPQLIKLKMTKFWPDPAVRDFFKAWVEPNGKDPCVMLALSQAVREYAVLSLQINHAEQKSAEEVKTRYEKIEALWARIVAERGWYYPYEIVSGKVPPLPPPAPKTAPTVSPPPIEEHPEIQAWIDVGYVPSKRCCYPGDIGAVKRAEAGECAAGPFDCVGEVVYCEACRIPYCRSRHGPAHVVREGQEVPIAAG